MRKRVSSTRFAPVAACMAAICLAGSLCGILFAQDPVPDTSLPGAQTPKPKRDPFAPVGVTAVASNSQTNVGTSITNEPPKPAVVTNWPLAESQLKITGVIEGSGGTMIAVINGRVVGAGESFSAVSGNLMYTWSVKSISKQAGVQLNRRGTRPPPTQKVNEEKKEEKNENELSAES